MTFEYGVAEHGVRRHLITNDKIPTGSITKAFTASLAMILVSDDDLELDVPVIEYAPHLADLPNDLGTRLTLRHLLSHTGGFPSDPSPEETVSLRRYVLECCRSLGHVAQPGDGFSYSNLGYVLVGHLIELVTGLTWSDAVDAILLRPLGITPCHVAPARPSDAFLVPGHSVNRMNNRVRPVEQDLPPAEAPTGALALSALDLVRFGQLHLGSAGESLISPAHLDEMHRATPAAEPFGLAHGWGLGFALFQSEQGEWFGHDGMGDGTSCHLRIDKASNTVVSLTTNANTGISMWRELVTELRRLGLMVGDYEALTGEERRMPVPPDCAGSYVNGDTEYSVTIHDDDQVRLDVDGKPSARLTMYEGLVFSMGDMTTGEQIHAGRLLRNERNGRIDRIQIAGRIAARPPQQRRRPTKAPSRNADHH